MSKYSLNLKPLIRKGIERHRGHWPEIAQRSGVSYSALVHFMQDVNQNPRLNTVQALLDVLADIDNGKIRLGE